MKNISCRLLLAALLSLVCMTVSAEEISLQASAPQSVVAGEPFQLVYIVNASGKDFRLPEIKGFEIIAGPYSSTSTNVQYINGKMTSTKEVRYTYTLLAQKEGSFSIPAASISVKGEKYHSNSLSITVLPEDKANSQSQYPGSSGSASSQNISAENLFVRPLVSKTKVYEQEAVVLTYKLFSRVDMTGINEVKFPDFKNFLVQEIDLPQDRSVMHENYQGTNYYTYELRKFILFPQQSGELVIDDMSCTVAVRLRTQARSRSFFDDFFDTYQDVNKTLNAGRVKINVLSLPKPKPKDFSGVVGRLSLSSSVSATEVKANEPITVVLKFSGSGNLKMLKTPELKFPSDFETYEPKVTNNFNSGSNGLSGSKTIEYLAIPRHDGNFTVPAVEISFFDSESGTYKTVSSQAFNILVAKSDVNSDSHVVANFHNQEQVAVLATDIRYIDTETPVLKPGNKTPFAGSPLFWLSYLLPLLITVALMIFFRKQARESADAALMRNKKANKVARKRLKKAGLLCKSGEKAAFYDEILRALWGYLSDKLSMPVAELNKENIADSLSQCGVSDVTISRFLTLLDDCEFERYAPMADSRAVMDKIYDDTLQIISALENSIKKGKRKNNR